MVLLFFSVLSLCSHCGKSPKLRTQLCMEGLVSNANKQVQAAGFFVFDSKGCWLNQSTLDVLGFIAHEMRQQLPVSSRL